MKVIYHSAHLSYTSMFHQQNDYMYIYILQIMVKLGLNFQFSFFSQAPLSDPTQPNPNPKQNSSKFSLFIYVPYFVFCYYIFCCFSFNHFCFLFSIFRTQGAPCLSTGSLTMFSNSNLMDPPTEIYLSIHLLPIYWFIYPSIDPPVRLSIRLSVCVCTSVCQSMSTFLFIKCDHRSKQLRILSKPS